MDPRHPTGPTPQVVAPLNEDWPPLPVPPHAPQPIDVVARLDWPGGEQHIPTRAVAWTRTHVMVVVGDPRLGGRWALWLRAQDVRRRPPS